MARRPGGRGLRRVVPGIRDALVDRERRFDAAFHRADGCGWCATITALEAGDPVQISGDLIASAVFNERRPREYDDLRGDRTLYAIVGSDTIEGVSD